jgi:Glycine cleavage system T protein (aminomethyltransferase)
MTMITNSSSVPLGAKLAPFAGFEMPIHYPKGIVQEHLAVRQRVGVFDVSHMGEFRIWGEDALPFLQWVTVNDVARLVPGRAQYSAMCYPHGGIVDDLLVYHCGGSSRVDLQACKLGTGRRFTTS